MIKEYRAISLVVLGLAAPLIGQSLLQTLIILIDRIMLGHYSTDALASMRINGTLIWCISGVLSGFAVGTVALVGRAIGSSDRTLASAAARSSLVFAVVVGIAASFLTLINLNSIIALFQVTETNLQQAAHEYLGIMLLAMPLMLLSIVAAAILQAAGDTRTPFLVAIAANVVNCVINYLLIFGHFGAPALGVKGAAIGSFMAMAINAIVLVLILVRGNNAIALQGSGGEIAALSRILRVSVSVFGDRLFRSIGYIGFTAMITNLGNVAMATHEAVLGIEEICYQSADGFGMAAATIVAQRLGAKRNDEATLSAIVASALTVALLGLAGLAFILVPTQLLNILSPDPKIISAGIPCLYVAAAAQPFMAISIVLEHVLRGAGDTRTALFVSLVGWFAVRLIATYLFTFVWHFGIVGIWLGSTCDWFVRSVVLMIVFWKGRWRESVV